MGLGEERFLAGITQSDRRALSRYMTKKNSTLMPRFLLRGLLEEQGFDVTDFEDKLLRAFRKISVNMAKTSLIFAVLKGEESKNKKIDFNDVDFFFSTYLSNNLTRKTNVSSSTINSFIKTSSREK